MNSSIGVFDSGLGGITVLSDLIRQLPQDNFIYIGDSKHAPYGEKDRDTITALSSAIISELIERGARAIVIACNTATSAAVTTLREQFELPIIGMEPALKPAIEAGKKRILVLATSYTIQNDKFLRLKEMLVKDQEVIPVAAPGLVRFVEAGIYEGSKLQDYLKDILKNTGDIDAVVLGCTHFLYMRKALDHYFGKPLDYFDGNAGTIQQLMSLTETGTGEGEVLIINTLGKEMEEKSKWMMQAYRNMNTGSTGNV